VPDIARHSARDLRICRARSQRAWPFLVDDNLDWSHPVWADNVEWPLGVTVVASRSKPPILRPTNCGSPDKSDFDSSVACRPSRTRGPCLTCGGSRYRS